MNYCQILYPYKKIPLCIENRDDSVAGINSGDLGVYGAPSLQLLLDPL